MKGIKFMNSLKIFISCISPKVFVPKSNIIQAVQVGASRTEERFEGMITDNTGENISSKNPMYCELTTQYWAWKNTDYDFYGFFHYRRYLSFNTELVGEPNQWNIINKDFLDEKTTLELGLYNEQQVIDLVSRFDIVTMKPIDLKKVGHTSVYEQYKTDGVKLHIEDLDILLDIIKEKHSDFYDTACEYLNGSIAYIGNIFIMRKKIFKNYCEWLFDILEEFEKRKDLSLYNMEGYRTPGHFGERLFAIYYLWLKKQGIYTSCELQLVFFSNTDKIDIIKPAFGRNNIPIAMVSNEYYTQFYAAAIQSIINSSSKQYNYDLIFLTRDILPKTEKLFLKMIAGNPNFSIRFVNVTRYFVNNSLYTSPTIGVETYFKLLIPEVLKSYSKVLYLDGDLIVKEDVANLFSIDIGDNLLGAVADIAAAGNVNGFDKELEKYAKKVLRLKKPYLQFNAGVLLINNSKMHQRFTTKYLLEFAQGVAFRFQDQDVLNVLCEDNIYWLPHSWNFMADEVLGYRGYVETFAPREMYLEYRQAALSPKILHYAGNEKPWLFPKQEWAEEFWLVFSQTPFFYGYLSQRMFDIAGYLTQQQLKEFTIKSNKQIGLGVKNALKKIITKVLPIGTRRRELFRKIYRRIK